MRRQLFVTIVGLSMINITQVCSNQCEGGTDCKDPVQSHMVPDGPVVTTSAGKYRGLPSNRHGVEKFLGIPFAKPPLGNLRFKPPELLEQHDGVFDATKQTPVCPQLKIDLGEKFGAMWGDFEQSEDCLFLDVYVPTANVQKTSDSRKAVMVWIHGGGYTMGFKDTYDGSVFAGLNDVIVVTINYRLGVLGFLFTEDENAVGNFGLSDQLLAIQWVQQNIEGFGGDKSRITIAGESAGAGSVTQLAIAPASAGLFHRVIAQSGSAVASWGDVVDPLSRVTSMAQSLGCPSDTTKELVECLRRASAFDFLEFQKDDLLSSIRPKWGPVYNSDLFPFTFKEMKTNWESLLTRGQLLHTDLMIGVNTEEGAMMYSFAEKGLQAQDILAEGKGISKEIFQQLLWVYAKLAVPEAGEALSGLLPVIAYKYTDWAEPRGEFCYTKMIVQMATDIMFNAPGVELARIHAKLAESFNDTGSESPAGGTFFYLFNQTANWMPTTPWRTGADHGDDVFFMFGFSLEDRFHPTDDEVLFSRQMMTYWANFVKSGNPNEPVTQDLPTWPRFEIDEEKYILLDKYLSEASVKSRMFPDRVEFWLDFIPKQMEMLKAISQKCSN